MRRWSDSSFRTRQALRQETNRIRGACAGGNTGARISNSLPGGHSEWEPPDPIPNSEVKTLCADGSVPFRHARVGHRQASNAKAPEVERLQGLFLWCVGSGVSPSATLGRAKMPACKLL